LTITPSITTALPLPALHGSGLWKRFGELAVVKGVDIMLRPGEVLGLLGPNGAGKTTTVSMLYGAIVPSSGTVTVYSGSRSWEMGANGRTARSLMGIVPQENSLDPDFSVFENLLNFARYYRLSGKPARNRAEELLALVKLTEFRNYPLEKLSGGLLRRLVLARALINNPQIIFLDEPTTGLDPDARQEFWKLVFELRRQGKAILLTTHYMDEAERLCDKLQLIQGGQIVDEGSPVELIERIVGREVAEVEGVPGVEVERIATSFSTWSRPFSEGFLIALPNSKAQEAWHSLESVKINGLGPTRLVRRRANLEDVFLVLTGKGLQ